MPSRQHHFADTHRWPLLALSALFILITPQAQTEIYKTVDEQGKVTFSDHKTPNADLVELEEPNTAEAVDIPEPGPSLPKLEISRYELTITSPNNNAVIANGLVGFTVSLSITPALATSDRLTLFINGKHHSNSRSNQFKVPSISRGEHQLQVKVFDEEENNLGASAPVTITALRPSSNN